MTKPTLKQVQNNCVYVTIDDQTFLFSYESPILKLINNDVVEIYENYDYSPTTTKHINKFIDSYGFLKLNDENIYPLDNKKRKKLLDQFYIDQQKSRGELPC